MPKKIVLAYSGGLDTSVILKWLQEKYQCPVATFTADLGQGEELSPVRDELSQIISLTKGGLSDSNDLVYNPKKSRQCRLFEYHTKVTLY